MRLVKQPSGVPGMNLLIRKDQMKQTLYHIVYRQGGQYRTLPVEDEFEAHHQIYNLSRKPTRVVLGVFDTRDGRFHWSLEEQARGEHGAKVAMICHAFESLNSYATTYKSMATPAR